MSNTLAEQLTKLKIFNVDINDNLELTQMADGNYYLSRGGEHVLLEDADPEDVRAVKDFMESRSISPIDEDDFIPGEASIDEDLDLDLSEDLEDL